MSHRYVEMDEGIDQGVGEGVMEEKPFFTVRKVIMMLLFFVLFSVVLGILLYMSINLSSHVTEIDNYSNIDVPNQHVTVDNLCGRFVINVAEVVLFMGLSCVGLLFFFGMFLMSMFKCSSVKEFLLVLDYSPPIIGEIERVPQSIKSEKHTIGGLIMVIIVIFFMSSLINDVSSYLIRYDTASVPLNPQNLITLVNPDFVDDLVQSMTIPDAPFMMLLTESIPCELFAFSHESTCQNFEDMVQITSNFNNFPQEDYYIFFDVDNYDGANIDPNIYFTTRTNILEFQTDGCDYSDQLLFTQKWLSDFTHDPFYFNAFEESHYCDVIPWDRTQSLSYLLTIDREYFCKKRTIFCESNLLSLVSFIPLFSNIMDIDPDDSTNPSPVPGALFIKINYSFSTTAGRADCRIDVGYKGLTSWVIYSLKTIGSFLGLYSLGRLVSMFIIDKIKSLSKGHHYK